MKNELKFIEVKNEAYESLVIESGFALRELTKLKQAGKQIIVFCNKSTFEKCGFEGCQVFGVGESKKWYDEVFEDYFELVQFGEAKGMSFEEYRSAREEELMGANFYTIDYLITKIQKMGERE